MTTSANVIEHSIIKDGKEVGTFRKNVLCRLPDYADLLKYQPLEAHTITTWGYDEEEDEWEGDEQRLDKFLSSMRVFNKKLKIHFENIES